ncbi:hypothetical protein AZI87_11455 [Bdellovibrio bacteriovorus]|uniref:Glycine zipper domain-containing protein n=1 Tax=Bdellovibrio bacteriovorus TaxID=959 RepID=A0A161PBR6_BDEBC|nr:hypothetical protein [Bdellovibrio bacteriovorus]KYG65176.1 hypothetical protein AZI87_11455 [Bdellovibrio bacteriovorus]
MRKIIFIIALLCQFQTAQAEGLRDFLKSCAWGTLGGAAVGVMSLAVEDKPSESWNNVAKGASLGLYAGIAYGLVKMNQEPKMQQAPDFAIVPQFQEGKVDGVMLSKTILDF